MGDTCVLYIRVSSDKQTYETYGLPEQLETCYTYAQQKGYTLVGDWYADFTSGLRVIKRNGVWRFANLRLAEKAGAKAESIKAVKCYSDDFTGKRASRPAMDALRDFVEREGLDVLVVRDTDRLARKKESVADYIKDWFRRRGIRIDYATQDFPDNAAGRAHEGMHDVMSEYFAEELREKSIRGQRRAVRSGSLMLPFAPYGYKRVGVKREARLEIDEDGAKIVRQIFGWYVYGEETTSKRLSLLAIAKRLTDLGIPTAWDKRGLKKARNDFGVWHPSSVRDILANTTYIGKWYYGKRRRVYERLKKNAEGRWELTDVTSFDAVPEDEWISVEVPRIVSDDIFNAAQDRLAENKRLAKRRTKHEYLLRGMLTCGECGLSMTGSASIPGYTYYRCTSHQWAKSNNRKHRCSLKSLRSNFADAAVWQEIRDRLLNLDNLVEGLKAQQAEAERVLEPLKDQLGWTRESLSECKARVSKILDLHIEGTEVQRIVEEKLAQEQGRIKELQKVEQDLIRRIEAGRISNESIATIEVFQEKVAKGLDLAAPEFELKRRILEILRLQGVVKQDGDQWEIVGSWLIPGSEIFVTVTNTPRCINHNTNNGVAFTFRIVLAKPTTGKRGG